MKRDQIIIDKKGKCHRKFRVKEIIGIAIINTRGVLSGNKSVIIGK